MPIYIAASGPKSAYLAGRYGDGWITGSGDFMKKSLRDAFARGAHAAGKDPAKMPKLVETFVVVGGRAEARGRHFSSDRKNLLMPARGAGSTHPAQTEQ